MPPPGCSRTSIAGFLLPIALCAPLFFHRLGGPALFDPDEGRNAEIAREMLETGDWVTPRLDEAPYLDKPPAFFWAAAASMRLFGVDERGARIPSALSALAGVALVFWFARRRLGREAGFITACILALTPIELVFARMVIFDMMLTLAMTIAAIAAFEAIEGEPSSRRARLAAAVFFAACGAGTIVKGPVALVLPLLVAGAWALAERRPSLILRLRFAIGVPIFAAVVLPWLLTVTTRNPGYLRYALLGEVLQRIVSDRFETSRGVFFYAKVILPGLFPWILFPVAAAAGPLRSLLARRGGSPDAAASAGDASPRPDTRAMRYAAIWATVIVVFFSLLRSKRPAYILPLSVPVALLGGGLWGRWFRGGVAAAGRAGSQEEARRPLAAGLALVAVGCWLLAALVFAAGRGDLLRTIGGGLYADLASRDGLIAFTVVALALTGTLILATRAGARPSAALASTALAVVVMIPVSRAVVGSFEEVRSSRSVARLLATWLRPQDDVLCFEEYRPGLNFYLRRPVQFVGGPGRTLTSNYLKMNIDRFKNRPGFHVLDPDRLHEWLAERGARAFLLAPRRAYDDLRAAAGLPLRQIYEDKTGAVFVLDSPRPGPYP
jgi:4-amino-4-deoxy-L-arabinose transferase-like glycosyltransferase